MMNLNSFKQEFRFINDGDVWGFAMEAWFECVGRMYKRGIPIPSKYHYRAGLGDGTDKDGYWFASFAKSSNQQLIVIAEFLSRYCAYLVTYNKNY